MALFFFIGLFAALAGFLYDQWIFATIWAIIFGLEAAYQVGKQAGRRQTLEAFDEPGSFGVEHLVAQREAAAERRQ